MCTFFFFSLLFFIFIYYYFFSFYLFFLHVLLSPHFLVCALVVGVLLSTLCTGDIFSLLFAAVMCVFFLNFIFMLILSCLFRSSWLVSERANTFSTYGFFLLILYFKLWLCVQINEWVKSKVSMEASTWATTVSTNEFASNIYTIWCVIVVFFFLSCGCEQKEREKERTSATHWHDAFANVDTHETNSNQNRTEFGPTRSKC